MNWRQCHPLLYWWVAVKIWWRELGIEYIPRIGALASWSNTESRNRYLYLLYISEISMKNWSFFFGKMGDSVDIIFSDFAVVGILENSNYLLAQNFHQIYIFPQHKKWVGKKEQETNVCCGSWFHFRPMWPTLPSSLVKSIELERNTIKS